MLQAVATEAERRLSDFSPQGQANMAWALASSPGGPGAGKALPKQNASDSINVRAAIYMYIYIYIIYIYAYKCYFTRDSCVTARGDDDDVHDNDNDKVYTAVARNPLLILTHTLRHPRAV